MRSRSSRVIRLLTLVAVLVAALLAGSAQAGASSRAPGANTSGSAPSGTPTAASRFLVPLHGHDRGISVTSKYVVTEYFSSGCCRPISTYTLQLSKAKYSSTGAPVAHIVVIKTHFDKGAYRFPGVKVGSSGIATIKHGIYEDTILQATFCTSKGGEGGACGA